MTTVPSDTDKVTAAHQALPSDLLQVARNAYRNGLCIIPASTGGEKKPWPDGPSWKRYQMERPAPSQIDAWFSGTRYDGFGIVCGRISGSLEMFEFEGRAIEEGVLRELVEIADASGLGNLWHRVFNGYREMTPSGGIHLVYRVTGTVAGNTKLARRPATPAELAENPDEKIKVLVETRGEGGFVVIAPSGGRTHESGKPWVLQSGGFDTIPIITAEERDALHHLAGAMDQMPTPEPVQVVRVPAQPGSFDGSGRPGDDYNARASWDEILLPRGWEKVYASGGVTYWKRPGKRIGISATTGRNAADNLYVFSTSTEFDAEKPYDKFAAYTLLTYGSSTPDALSAAAKELHRRGYGSRINTQKTNTVPRPGGVPQMETITGTAPLENEESAPWPSALDQAGEPSRRLILTPASQIRIRPVRWMWDTTPEGEPPTSHGRIPMNSLAIAAGGPGLGKSQFGIWLTAQITTGTLPGELYGKPRSVIYAATEDSWSYTIAPRLVAAGADLDRVFRVDVFDDGEPHARLTLPVDTSLLGKTAEEYSVALLVADPLLSMIDKSLSDYRAAEVRQALEPLVAAADRHHFTILGLAHFTKSGGADPLSRIAGSGAFGQLIRSMIAFAREDGPDDGESRCVMSLVKNNLGRLGLPSHTFEILPVTIPTDEGDSYVSRFVLGEETSLSVKEVLREEANPDLNREETNDSVKWLRAHLADNGGQDFVDEIKKAAAKEGISPSAIQRARKKLGIAFEQSGFGSQRRSMWVLPEAKVKQSS